jgi:hypothetical protein
MGRCKHGLAEGTCASCADPQAFRTKPTAGRRTSAGGISEPYRGFTIFYTPPPERVWSFRPRSDAPLESHRSAFQARKAIDILIDGYATSSTPRRDSRTTSAPRQHRPTAQKRSPPPRETSEPRDIPKDAPSGDLARLLGAESNRPVTVTLPISQRQVTVTAFQRREQRFLDALPANFRTIPNKVAVDLDGSAVYPEFAMIRRLEAAGWGAAWRKNWHGTAFWSDIGVTCEVPDEVLALFERVSDVAGAGAWDILAWKEGQVLFIESKEYGSDKLTANQLRWLETALDQGLSIDSFAIHEYRA